jgi:hypothetical protein
LRLHSSPECPGASPGRLSGAAKKKRGKKQGSAARTRGSSLCVDLVRKFGVESHVLETYWTNRPSPAALAFNSRDGEKQAINTQHWATVVARSAATKQSIDRAGRMDCFASLAMTVDPFAASET